jgi:hypothetical protein
MSLEVVVVEKRFLLVQSRVESRQLKQGVETALELAQWN